MQVNFIIVWFYIFIRSESKKLVSIFLGPSRVKVRRPIGVCDYWAF